MPENSSEQPSPYEILGISKAADLDEIKDAFRGIVKENHPDINSNGDPYLVNQASEAYRSIRSERTDTQSTPNSAPPASPEQKMWTDLKRKYDQRAEELRERSNQRVQEIKQRQQNIREQQRFREEEAKKISEEIRAIYEEQMAAAQKRMGLRDELRRKSRL